MCCAVCCRDARPCTEPVSHVYLSPQVCVCLVRMVLPGHPAGSPSQNQTSLTQLSYSTRQRNCFCPLPMPSCGTWTTPTSPNLTKHKIFKKSLFKNSSASFQTTNPNRYLVRQLPLDLVSWLGKLPSERWEMPTDHRFPHHSPRKFRHRVQHWKFLS